MADTTGNLPGYTFPREESGTESVPSIPSDLRSCPIAVHHGNLAGFDGLAGMINQHPTSHQQSRFGESFSNAHCRSQGHTQWRAGRRVSLACNNCRTRHRRCSPGDPCMPCIQRGIAEGCRRHTRKTWAHRAEHVAQNARVIPPPDHAVPPTSSTRYVTQTAQTLLQPNAYAAFASGSDIFRHGDSAPAVASDYPMGSDQPNVDAQYYPGEVIDHFSGAPNLHIRAMDARVGPLHAAGVYGEEYSKEGWELPAYDQGMGAFHADDSRGASHFHRYK